MVTHYSYNIAGERASQIVDVGAGPSHANARTNYYYNVFGGLQFEVAPQNQADFNPNGYSRPLSYTQHFYDDFDNRIRTEDFQNLIDFQNYRITNYEYDLNNRLTGETVDPTDGPNGAAALNLGSGSSAPGARRSR